MAHPLNDLINKKEKRQAIKCDVNCKYFTFAHLEIACVLSEVYSVPQNTPCYEYTPKKQ